MTRGDVDALLAQHARRCKAGVILGRERDEARKSAGGIEQAKHGVRIRWTNRIARMRAAIAVDRADERALDMDPGDHLPRQWIVAAQLDDAAQTPLHHRQMIRDNSGKKYVAPVRAHALTGVVKIFGGQRVAVEVDAAVAVDLQVEEPLVAHVTHANY